VAVPVPQGVT